MLFPRGALKTETRAVLAGRGYTGGEQSEEIGRFLRAAEDLIGVLVEQGPDWFGFMHLTFQEFYAARAIVHRSSDAARLIARYWDHPDWREVWPLYALAVQTDAAKLEHLFRTILASGADLDAQLFRPQLACLRLAGLGGAPLPPAIAPVLDWATNVLKGAGYPLFEIMDRLAAWERRLTPELRSAVLARLADDRAVHAPNGGAGAGGCDGRAGGSLRAAPRLADDDWVVRWAAMQALSGAMGEREVRAALLGQLADRHGSVRHAAARVLASAVGEQEVSAALLLRLADEEWDVRREAARALAGAVSEREIRDALLARLGRDEELVRQAAAWALASVASEAEVRDALLARLSHAELYVRQDAAEALAGAVGEQQVRAALLARLGDNDGLVRQAAVQALAAVVGEAKVRAALVARLGDNDEAARFAAVGALASAVGEAEVRDTLLARLDDNAGVRWSAVRH